MEKKAKLKNPDKCKHENFTTSYLTIAGGHCQERTCNDCKLTIIV